MARQDTAPPHKFRQRNRPVEVACDGQTQSLDRSLHGFRQQRCITAGLKTGGGALCSFTGSIFGGGGGGFGFGRMQKYLDGVLCT